MKLRKRQKRKTQQALDAAASVTSLWSDWQIGKRAGKGVAKAKQLAPPASKVKCLVRSKWLKVGGLVAVGGGAAAAIARKLKGGEPEAYTGPAPSVAAAAGTSAPDAGSPLSVAPDPATRERDTETVGGPSTLRGNRDAAAAEDAPPPAEAPAAADEPAAAAEPADGDEPAAEPAAAEEPVAADAGEGEKPAT